MKERVVLHADCNSFFASVECKKRPELKEVPMAVAGDPESRHGIILAKNEKVLQLCSLHPFYFLQELKQLSADANKTVFRSHA